MALRDRLAPRRRTTGTSLTTAGESAPPQAEREIGSSVAAPIREIVPDLVSRYSESRTYYQMSTYHAVTRSSLRAVKSSVMGAEFYTEPAGDDQDSMDQDEFVHYNLFSALSSPWLVTIARILKFCEYGFSMMEPVFENREWAPNRKMANRKTYTMLKKLGPRPASTIKEIIYDDNGGPVEVKQNAIGKDYKLREVTIPIEKLIIFTNDEEGGDLMGKSMLRSAYPHWYYGQHLYKIDAIQKERHAIGIPRAIMPPGIKDKKEKAAAQLMVKNIRTNEHAGIVQPDGWEIDFIKPEGQLVDVIKSIEHHNSMIMLNVLAEFLIAGVQESGGGGRAVSASQQDIFMKANRAMADLICDAFNLYLIPQLIRFNFDTDKFPKLRVRNLGDTRDQQQLASALASMFDKEILTPDLPTEQWARRIFDMPSKVGERPEFSPTQIRKIINQSLQDPNASNGASTAGISGRGNGGNSSTRRDTGGQGNMGKGNDVS